MEMAAELRPRAMLRELEAGQAPGAGAHVPASLSAGPSPPPGRPTPCLTGRLLPRGLPSAVLVRQEARAGRRGGRGDHTDQVLSVLQPCPLERTRRRGAGIRRPAAEGEKAGPGHTSIPRVPAAGNHERLGEKDDADSNRNSNNHDGSERQPSPRSAGNAVPAEGNPRLR